MFAVDDTDRQLLSREKKTLSSRIMMHLVSLVRVLSERTAK